MAERQTNRNNPSQTMEDNRSQEHAQRGRAGRGWHGDPEGHAAAGRKGGLTVSQNREHMARIGRKGGLTVSRDRRHMADIGRKGGQARGERTPEEQASGAETS
ncbi:MAG TPA: hypothetical protein VFB38_23160 [Chthonomonadaceae bacterium]|nr:hypothetical protein [Chthonomonadaceae bacterium]